MKLLGWGRVNFNSLSVQDLGQGRRVGGKADICSGSAVQGNLDPPAAERNWLLQGPELSAGARPLGELPRSLTVTMSAMLVVLLLERAELIWRWPKDTLQIWDRAVRDFGEDRSDKTVGSVERLMSLGGFPYVMFGSVLFYGKGQGKGKGWHSEELGHRYPGERFSSQDCLRKNIPLVYVEFIGMQIPVSKAQLQPKILSGLANIAAQLVPWTSREDSCSGKGSLSCPAFDSLKGN